MKKLLLSAVSLAVLTGSAIAADLPTRKEAVLPPPPSFTWTGLFGGVNVGYGFSANNSGYGSWTAPSVNVAGSGTGVSNASGVLGGGQIGYNYQWNPYLVLGVEADAQASDINGNSYGARGAYTGNAISMGQNNLAIDWFGTARGRIGLTMPGYSNFMVYGTGGFAYGNAYANVVQTAYENVSGANGYLQTNTWVGGGRQNQLLTGWTAGGGAEWMFMPNWSLKAEALYWDLGRMNVQTASYGVSGNANTVANTVGWGRSSVSYQGVQAKVGVNYHFNWGAAPIVAAY